MGDMDEMRRDRDKSILLCFQETSSESDPQFSPGSLIRLRRVPREGRARGVDWVGSSSEASEHPPGAVQAGASRRELGLACRALESRSPGSPTREPSFPGLSDALGSPQAFPLASSHPFQHLHSAGFSSSSSALS